MIYTFEKTMQLLPTDRLPKYKVLYGKIHIIMIVRDVGLDVIITSSTKSPMIFY